MIKIKKVCQGYKRKSSGVEEKLVAVEKGMYKFNLTNLTNGCRDGQNAGNDLGVLGLLIIFIKK